LPQHTQIHGVYRIIDANINRAKEGLRVCEEITRFIVCDRGLTSRFKDTRHALDALVAGYRRDPRLLAERASRADVGRTVSNAGELSRRDWRDVFAANLQRVKESVRVLEEFSKLIDVRRARALKALRYAIYDLEKKVDNTAGNRAKR
jgi:thiamine-phosphate pyrophosphorylase